MNSVRCKSRIRSGLHVLAVAAVLSGCGGCRGETKPTDTAASKIAPGMTVDEIDRLVGASGTEVAFTDLPAVYRTILEKPAAGTEPIKGEGIVFRKWTRTIGATSATSYAAFRDGRVVDGTVFLESVRTVQ